MGDVYLDHAASAPLLPEAREALLAALDAGPGNPGSSHAAGRAGRARLEDARESIAAALAFAPEELVFTSGATEAMQLAILGSKPAPTTRVVASPAVHPTTRRLLENHYERVHWLPLDRDALVPSDAALPEEVELLVLSWVESVTGALEDVPRLAAQAKDAGASVVVDATQAVGRVPLSLDETLDAVCWSAHKLGAPVGIGALRIAPDAPWGAPWGSGSQERGRRSGTEAVALASAFAAAVGVSVERLPRLPARADGVFAPLDAWAATTDEVQVVGRAPRRVPTTRLLTVPGCRGDLLVAALDRRGLRVSTGTACASGARTPAEVLLATGRTAREALSAVRISIGWGSTRAEIQALVDALREIVPTARGGHPES